MKTKHIIIGIIAVVAIYFLFFRGKKKPKAKTKKDAINAQKEIYGEENVEEVSMKDGTSAILVNGKLRPIETQTDIDKLSDTTNTLKF